MPFTYTWTPETKPATSDSKVTIRTWDNKPVPGASYTITPPSIVITVPTANRYSLTVRTHPVTENAKIDIPIIQNSTSLEERMRTLITQSTADLARADEVGPVAAIDDLVRAQGALYKVSNSAPTQTTYTTQAGEVFPVIWTSAATRPALPTEPTWDNVNSRFTVPNIVGVDYYQGTTKLTPATPITTPVNTTVTVKAEAQYGYVLPGTYSWNHYFPDPAAVTILASDDFNSADLATLAGRPWNNVLGGTLTKSWLSHSGNWTLTSNAVTPPANNVRSANHTQFTEAENQRLEFDLITTPFHGMDFRVCGNNAWGGVGIAIDGTNGNVRYVVSRSGGGFEFKSRTGRAPTGHYVIQYVNKTVSITVPTVGTFHYDNSAFHDASANQYGRYVGIDASGDRTTVQRGVVDNVVVSKVGW